MADIKALEHPTLKVPYEILNKKFRAAQKQLDREVSHVQSAALEVERGLGTERCSVADINQLLGGMVEKLQVLKRKAEESICEELQAGYVCKRRLEHLKEHTSQSQWCRKRLDRMLVEYFLRRGYYAAAQKLAQSSGLEDLTNIDVFLVSKEVERSLMSRETTKCLAWCHDNRSKLRKLHSTMEFNLRIQEFVELVKADRRLEAVKHARKYFSSYEEGQLISIQHCMALLAFPVTTELSPYKELLEEERWGRLVEQFRQENYKLFQLATQSVFTVALQAGLSALKTPQCYSGSEAKNKSCPVCQDWLNILAEPLPFAHCSNSRLICHISGLPLNEHNQPMVLPNSRVYGQQSLQAMADENYGNVVCPRTQEVYSYSKAEKVYVM
uniref:E3 ubiquitin-protein transferase MAEA n=2 Tax=Lygus hesperus TaxID=30085 RepID=A0A0A9YIX7_LYGHE